MTDIVVPVLGESVTEAIIASWSVSEGDAVVKDQILVELETDKVSIEVSAPEDGVLSKIVAQEGDEVEIGALIGILEAGSGKATSGKAAAPTEKPTTTPEPVAAKPASDIKTMPSAARKIAETGADASTIAGTGKAGRITKGDVIAAAKTPAAVVAVETGPRQERVKMSRLRQTIARRLKEAQNTAAILTTFNEVDMTAIMASRKKYQELFVKKHGIKLGFMSFFVKACVQALKDIPEVNAEIDGDTLIFKNHYDIGVAVGTEKGLVVPVITDCDALSMGGVEQAIANMGAKARDGKLTMADMSGATFTISNGGVYGSLMSTPILNAPQSGILGMHTIQKRTMVVNDEIVIRPMMYIALSYDHRVVDGKGAVTFLIRVKECLENPDRLLFDL
ncbi:MAG: 2-oxoglutarate dehydrogenase complex dihydrolipoyllysine-residue succinyltransferase [Robiginitomaculum sp.]|nr:2-oxoglutarate dehydrogenase complex dihydrolipoyllysine-residue succinyltransferase [Robiginitomaculum sp.]